MKLYLMRRRCSEEMPDVRTNVSLSDRQREPGSDVQPPPYPTSPVQEAQVQSEERK